MSSYIYNIVCRNKVWIIMGLCPFVILCTQINSLLFKASDYIALELVNPVLALLLLENYT